MDIHLGTSVDDKTFGLMTGKNELIKKCEKLNLPRTCLPNQQTSKSSGWVIKVASRDTKKGIAFYKVGGY